MPGAPAGHKRLRNSHATGSTERDRIAGGGFSNPGSAAAQSELAAGTAAMPKQRATVAICAFAHAARATVLVVAVATVSAAAAVVEVRRKVLAGAAAAGRAAGTHPTTTAAVRLVAPRVDAGSVAAGLT